MSFEEKALWTSLLLPGGFWLWYFANIAADAMGAAPIDEGRHLTRLLVIIGLTAVAQLVVMAAIGWRTPGASLVPDERERRIMDRGASRAYTLLTTGILVLVFGAWIGWSGFVLINALVFLYLAADVVRIFSELRMHRSRLTG